VGAVTWAREGEGGDDAWREMTKKKLSKSIPDFNQNIICYPLFINAQYNAEPVLGNQGEKGF